MNWFMSTEEYLLVMFFPIVFLIVYIFISFRILLTDHGRLIRQSEEWETTIKQISEDDISNWRSVLVRDITTEKRIFVHTPSGLTLKRIETINFLCRWRCTDENGENVPLSRKGYVRLVKVAENLEKISIKSDLEDTTEKNKKRDNHIKSQIQDSLKKSFAKNLIQGRKIQIVVARADDGTIGDKGSIPWSIPEDLKNFKELTSGTTLVMGRKTFESLPGLLPGRRHVVLTRNKLWKVPGVDIASSLEEVLSITKEETLSIIGGAEVIRLFEPLADIYYLTQVHKNPNGDTKLEYPNLENWKIIVYPIGKYDKELNNYSFITLAKKRKHDGILLNSSL